MQVESTPSRVFIYDLDAEIAEAEAAEAADAPDAARPVFLPDIERHLMRLPRALLLGNGGGGGSGGYEHKGGGDADDVGSDESDDGLDSDDDDDDARTARRHRRESSGRKKKKKNMQLIKYAEPPPTSLAVGPASFASSLAALASRDRPSSTAHDRRAMAAARAWDFAGAEDGPWTGFGGGAGPRTSPGVVARLAAAAIGDEYRPGDDGDAMDLDVDMDLDI
jgi:hypothetical protein